MDAFERLWQDVDDPRRQMDLAVLYLTIRRDLDGVVLDVDRLVQAMARQHRWTRTKTRRLLDELLDLGLVTCEEQLDGGASIYRLSD